MQLVWFLWRWNECRIKVGYILLWGVDGRLGREPGACNVDLILCILHDKVIAVLDDPGLSPFIVITDEPKTYHLVQSKAKSTCCGQAGILPIAVDWLPTPRPKVKVDIVIL